jgi:hypothetical protein
MPAATGSKEMAGAVALAAKLEAEQDKKLLAAVVKFRKKLALPLTSEDLRQASQVAEAWGPSVDQRLELAARKADLMARVMATLPTRRAERASLLRSQTAIVQSLAAALQVTLAILEAIDDVEARVSGGPYASARDGSSN